MSDTHGDQRRSRGLEIPEELARAAGVPADLDSDVVDPFAVPDPARRRRSGLVYVIAAAITAVGASFGLPEGMWILAVVFLVIAGYHAAAAWHLRVREGRALEIANRSVAFAVGHASAAVGFVGWRARPVWNVLVFSADDPPSRRGLVRVDAITGDVVGSYVESLPEAER